jgi:hypothetical protein
LGWDHDGGEIQHIHQVQQEVVAMPPLSRPDLLQQLRSGRIQGGLWRGWPGLRATGS